MVDVHNDTDTPELVHWHEVDFVADNPGPTLFHCHQLHMDFGFMALFNYA